VLIYLDLQMEFRQALEIATNIKEQLSPHCIRCEIAGSIRREKPVVKDIEIVAIPKPYNVGLFESGIATIVNKWTKIKGELPCKYTQRLLPEGIALDLFFATEQNWGLIYAIRTGSADYSHNVLANAWVKNGFKSVNGILVKNGYEYSTPTEKSLFDLIGVQYLPPPLRNVH
jgi:DNA polymerase/3'-5' exonuclease PolX